MNSSELFLLVEKNAILHTKRGLTSQTIRTHNMLNSQKPGSVPMNAVLDVIELIWSQNYEMVRKVLNDKHQRP